MASAIGNPMNAIKKPFGSKLLACELGSGKSGSWVNTRIVEDLNNTPMIQFQSIMTGMVVSVDLADLEEIIRWAKGQ